MLLSKKFNSVAGDIKNLNPGVIMHILKRLFTASGYWIHKISTLPVGADMFVDIHNRIGYGSINTMFDIGANTGQTWDWFRRHERNTKIYCFEPVAAPFLELKIKTKNDKNCILENIAFGNVQAEKTIKLFEGNHSVLNSLKDELMNDHLNAGEEIIKIDTVDNYCWKKGISKIDLLKIDTEGYELNVLEGAKNMLSAAGISFIYCEAGFLKENNRNTYFIDLTEWLATHDYYFFGLYKLASNAWKIKFGNALFVHKNILLTQRKDYNNVQPMDV